MNFPKLIPFLLFSLVALWSVSAQESMTKEKLYAAGIKAEQEFDFIRALPIWQRLAKLDDDYERVAEFLGDCPELVGWQKKCKGTPGGAELVELGEIYWELLRYNSERHCYEEAVRVDPAYSEGHGHLALWNYTTRGGNILTVIEETRQFLRTSPFKKQLTQAIADFDVYGGLRTIGGKLGPVVSKSRKANKDGSYKQAVEILIKAVKPDQLDVFNTWLLARAGKILLAKGDDKTAGEIFQKALTHVACSASLEAHLGLAILALRQDQTAKAMHHLRNAVAEGSGACRSIAAQRDKALKPLFQSTDEKIREEMKKLSDQELGDEPIRKEIRAALTRAKQEKKLVLLHLYGPYCPYVMMLEERLAHPKLRKLLQEKFVHVRINYGSHHKAQTLDTEYGNVFQSLGVPSFYILKPDGSVKDFLRCDKNIQQPPHRAYDMEKIHAALLERTE